MQEKFASTVKESKLQRKNHEVSCEESIKGILDLTDEKINNLLLLKIWDLVPINPLMLPYLSSPRTYAFVWFKCLTEACKYLQQTEQYWHTQEAMTFSTIST